MGEINTESYNSIKQTFYDAFNDSTILEFGREFAHIVNGVVNNIYRLQDGIHIGINTNMGDVTEKEIMDIFSTHASEFIFNKLNDNTLANYTKNNIPSLIKILFIDKENFTIII